MTSIYLASKSPRRRELLKQIGVHFESLLLREHPIERRDVDEAPLANEVATDYVPRIVLAKAAAANRIMRSRRLPIRPILTADTTVVCNNTILGKPRDEADAARLLALLSNRSHQVITIVALTVNNETTLSTSVNEVTFRALSDADIRAYIDTGESLDKAGGYGIQGKAAAFISHLSGSYSGVMGLPLFETAELLRNAGIQF